ncbi:hypothetical protein [Stutzerimonas nitrititolerans]|uniref:hypothetical protein n=1 Tax=Stutzerimonas nitrititolerans TaxID=2482751 RepID=UPI0028B23E79|nr:hypothetical protein [Stutzerimonas nitrititolerans]
MVEHIHTPGDGRGRRDVWVNGHKIDGVVWADTRAGVVVFMPRPFRVHRRLRDQVYTRKLRGKVEVVLWRKQSNSA